MFSSEAFYSLTVDVKDAFSEYYLEVSLKDPACKIVIVALVYKCATI